MCVPFQVLRFGEEKAAQVVLIMPDGTEKIAFYAGGRHVRKSSFWHVGQHTDAAKEQLRRQNIVGRMGVLRAEPSAHVGIVDAIGDPATQDSAWAGSGVAEGELLWCSDASRWMAAENVLARNAIVEHSEIPFGIHTDQRTRQKVRTDSVGSKFLAQTVSLFGWARSAFIRFR
jgi:hypothetical protein